LQINYTFNLYNFNCIYDLIILDYLYYDQHLSNDYFFFLIRSINFLHNKKNQRRSLETPTNYDVNQYCGVLIPSLVIITLPLFYFIFFIFGSNSNLGISNVDIFHLYGENIYN
jgi:hypothetical protein